MSTTPPSPPPARRPAADAPIARGIFVRVAILLTAVIFLGTVFVIYYRWVTVEEPISVVVVNADETLDGAVVTVDGVVLAEPLRAELDERGRYHVRFFLHPGSYAVRVDHHGEVVFDEQFMVMGRRQQMLKIDLVANDASQER